MPYVNMPKLSDTMTEGTLVKWRKNVGDQIEIGDILAEIETDKATMEMEAFEEGVLGELCVPEGSVVKVGDRIALIGEPGEAKSEPKKSAAPATPPPAKPAVASATPKAPAPAPRSASARVKASPLARKVAAALNVDLGRVSGTGPGGRIVRSDVEESARGGGTGRPAATPAIRAASGIAGAEQRIPLGGMRRTIAERLLASKTQIPHFYLSIEVNAAPLAALRREVNALAESRGEPKITVNDFILLAAARAAASVPKVNAAFDGDAIVQYEDINLAVAVSVEDGLITPVIRAAQKLSLREISAQMKDLAARARGKKLKPEEYQGGTMTVSNLGGQGIETFLPIINPPQSFILGIGAIVKKPVVNERDEIVVGQRLFLSASGDHRVIDGAVAAEYMNALRKLVESPALMLF